MIFTVAESKIIFHTAHHDCHLYFFSLRIGVTSLVPVLPCSECTDGSVSIAADPAVLRSIPACCASSTGYLLVGGLLNEGISTLIGQY